MLFIELHPLKMNLSLFIPQFRPLLFTTHISQYNPEDYENTKFYEDCIWSHRN